MKKYRCKLCGFLGPVELVNRHIALTHKTDAQPRCKVCGDAAEVWATGAKKTAYCNMHRNRYGRCRWCGHSREIGFGQGVAACMCGRMGYLRDEAIAAPVSNPAPEPEEDALAGSTRWRREHPIRRTVA